LFWSTRSIDSHQVQLIHLRASPELKTSHGVE
jgi:hypothetical protein